MCTKYNVSIPLNILNYIKVSSASLKKVLHYFDGWPMGQKEGYGNKYFHKVIIYTDDEEGGGVTKVIGTHKVHPAWNFCQALTQSDTHRHTHTFTWLNTIARSLFLMDFPVNALFLTYTRMKQWSRPNHLADSPFLPSSIGWWLCRHHVRTESERGNKWEGRLQRSGYICGKGHGEGSGH